MAGVTITRKSASPPGRAGIQSANAWTARPNAASSSHCAAGWTTPEPGDWYGAVLPTRINRPRHKPAAYRQGSVQDTAVLVGKYFRPMMYFMISELPARIRLIRALVNM